MTERVLNQRELNRATLARQMLLQRACVDPRAAVESLTALQAQVARSPFVALWSRTSAFDAETLRRLIMKRQLVKSTLMRNTLHVTSARDYLRFRPALSASLAASARTMLKDRMEKIDAGTLAEIGRSYFSEPHTFAEFFTFLESTFPGGDVRALGYTIRVNVPLVQVPSDSPWSFPTSPARFVLAELWLKKDVPTQRPADDLVLRYLGALGPATVADISSWTSLRAVRAVVDRVRDKLVAFRNVSGKEVFDLKDSPRPLEDTPAPVRFLPEFDNILLSGADRTRFFTTEQQRLIFRENFQYLAPILVDGSVAGSWRIVRTKKRSTLQMEAFDPVSKPVRDELAAEGLALLAFAEPDAPAHDIEFTS